MASIIYYDLLILLIFILFSFWTVLLLITCIYEWVRNISACLVCFGGYKFIKCNVPLIGFVTLAEKNTSILTYSISYLSKTKQWTDNVCATLTHNLQCYGQGGIAVYSRLNIHWPVGRGHLMACLCNVVVLFENHSLIFHLTEWHPKSLRQKIQRFWNFECTEGCLNERKSKNKVKMKDVKLMLS